MAHRHEFTLRILSFIGVLIGTFSPAWIAGAQKPGTADITVQIENIHYEGKDAYSLVVSTANSSPKDVLVKIIEEGFFIQTDHGWARLKANQKDRESGEFLLARAGKKQRGASIGIPLDMPDLFSTYEGDLSLMYKYTYTVRTADGIGAAFQRADEVYCWVKPGTSQWILREGM